MRGVSAHRNNDQHQRPKKKKKHTSLHAEEMCAFLLSVWTLSAKIGAGEQLVNIFFFTIYKLILIKFVKHFIIIYELEFLSVFPRVQLALKTLVFNKEVKC